MLVGGWLPESPKSPYSLSAACTQTPACISPTAAPTVKVSPFVDASVLVQVGTAYAWPADRTAASPAPMIRRRFMVGSLRECCQLAKQFPGQEIPLVKSMA